MSTVYVIKKTHLNIFEILLTSILDAKQQSINLLKLLNEGKHPIHR